jgi:hypothetical protein
LVRITGVIDGALLIAKTSVKHLLQQFPVIRLRICPKIKMLF